MSVVELVGGGPFDGRRIEIAEDDGFVSLDDGVGSVYVYGVDVDKARLTMQVSSSITVREAS